ncbi:MAG: hypothetical protein AAF694_03105 [Bacteroidota bacterium]
MKFFFLWASLILGIPIQSWAQIPGYEGKRALIDLSVDLSPAIRIASRRDLPPYIFNVQALLEAEYTMNRKLSLGGHIQPLLAGVNYEVDNFEGRAQIRGMGIGLSARLYSFQRKGNIAPLGPYKKLEIFYVTYWMTDEDERFYQDGRTWLGRYHDLGVGLTLGDRRMLGDGLSIHYGIRFATIFGTLDGSRKPERAYLKDIATDRLQGYFFTNFHIGMGILIF